MNNVFCAQCGFWMKDCKCVEITKNIDIDAIILKPNDFPEEVVSAAYDWLAEYEKRIKESKRQISLNLLKRMQEDEATKIVFYDVEGNQKIITRNSGKWDCKAKDVDITYKKNNFDPLEIGENVFKPSWTKAKKARKFGGKKKKLIDSFFEQGDDFITIKEVNK